MLGEGTERESYTYYKLWEIAKEGLTDARKRGRRHGSVHCIVYSAFMLESFLNDLCADLLGFWNKRFRESLSPEQKYVLAGYELGLEPDFGQRPDESFLRLFSLRNWIAHSRRERAEASDPEEDLDLHWDDLEDVDLVETLFENADTIIGRLLEAAERESPGIRLLETHGFREWSRTIRQIEAEDADSTTGG